MSEHRVLQSFFKNQGQASREMADEIKNEVNANLAENKKNKTPYSLAFEQLGSYGIKIQDGTVSNKIERVIPTLQIDTKDPIINTKEFAKKNLRIVLENEYMVLQALRQLSEIENKLLYFLVDKSESLSKMTVEERKLEFQPFLQEIKDRLVIFRDPVNRKLFDEFTNFYGEFKITLNYLMENRAWQAV